MIARSERVTNHHKLRLYRTAAIISYKPQPLRTNIEQITRIQQHLAELSTLTTRALIPHIQALHSSHPPPHTSAHQSVHSQVDSKHPQASCAHKGSKEHHTNLQMQPYSQQQSTFSYSNKIKYWIRLRTLTITTRTVPAPDIFTPQVCIFPTLNTRAMRNIFKIKHNHTYR